MRKQPFFGADRGAVLILTLWAVAFLTVLAVNLGVGIRQQITFLSRLEKREVLRLAAHSGVEKARAMVRHYFGPRKFSLNRQSKEALLGDPEVFKGIRIGNAICDLSYIRKENGEDVEHYGINDEEGKLNINTADMEILSRLFGELFGFPKEKSEDLASRVLEWREGLPQGSKLERGASYGKLDYPYGPKGSKFERVEELALIPGIDAETYARLQDYVTVYGSGRVNLNTASREVLIAVGMNQALCDKILLARRGKDGVEGTDDDLLFGVESGAEYIAQYVPLDDDDMARLYILFTGSRIGAQSQYFQVVSRARFAGVGGEKSSQSDEIKSITSVFQSKDGKIVYWREE